MLEAAALAWTFLAFALFHAGARGGAAVARAAAPLSLALGVAQWSRVEDTSAALLVVLGALCAAATLFVLLVPVFPRATWGAALACAPAALVLSLCGGCHG